MRPENKAKVLETIDEWLNIIEEELTHPGDFQYVLLEIRGLIVGDNLESREPRDLMDQPVSSSTCDGLVHGKDRTNEPS